MSALLLATACAPGLEGVAPEVGPEPRPAVGVVGASEEERGGQVRVGVPEQPPGWLPLPGTPAMVGDLAALWGVPLYHLDAAGQPRPALVEAAEVAADGTQVRLRLRPGRWSDGEPVTADDVVATVAALRDAGVPEAQAVVDATAEALDEVLLTLDGPARSWPGALGQVGVLPAHVLEAEGLEGASSLEVTAGPFRLESHEAGLGARFVAHAEGPLGAPVLDAVEAVVVPDVDTALGLLAGGDLDAVVGHLAVRPERRVEALGGDVQVAAPAGGTTVTLTWRQSGAMGGDADRRRALAHRTDARQQVQGFDLGLRQTHLAPGGTAPADPVGEGEDDLEDLVAGVDASIVIERESEMLGVTASLLEAQVRGQDGRLRVARLPTPHDRERAEEHDGRLEVRRDGPWTSLASWAGPADPGPLLAADRAPALGAPEAADGLEHLDAAAWITPLYRPRVLHAWRSDVGGVAPSSWPGAGFVSAPRWHRTS